MLNDINARLLSLENIRSWEKNPDLYSSGITNSIFVIMARTFAPPADRLKSVIAREKQVPAVFQAARQNLKNPPPIYVDVALEQIPGLISFFQKDVPAAFKDVKDQALLAQFQAANQKVMDELKNYGQWVEKDLKPQAHGDFRIGADNYSKKLLYDEDVDIPLARLLEIGMTNLRLNQQAFKETAAKLDPNKTPQEILAELEKDHPAPDKLLQTFRDTLGGLKNFLSQHQHRKAAIGSAAYCSGDATICARSHLRFHGHARTIRESCERSFLQRHLARSKLEAGASGRAHGRFQSRDDHLHGGA